MADKGSRLLRRIPVQGWWAVFPTAAIAALILLLTSSTGVATAGEPRVLLTEVLFQEQQPMCQSCHPQEYEEWKATTHAQATLDPTFQEQLSKSHNQAACLACHTTGFDTGSGKFLSEGVTCEACHGPYKEGHPAAATMQLPMASETCRMCHLETFKEWESSKHAEKKIECFDCHLAHNQGLRLGSEEKLCAACHTDRQTEFAHATHGIKGVDCAGCHMSPVPKDGTEASQGQMPVNSHTFQVGSDVCAGCHKTTIHTAASAGAGAVSAGLELAANAGEQAGRAGELEQEVTDLQSRVASIRNAAVVSMGLAFGLGGFIGLLAGVMGMSLMRRRNPNE